MSLPKQLALTFVLMSVLPMIVFSQTAASDENVRSLIRELRNNRWEGPISVIPLQWNLLLTEPMRKILEIGSPAQQALIDNISDPIIKDQVILLLGGVGDERSIDPIILAMIRKKDLKSTHNSEQINLVANIALTNITVADVIWHHGGGWFNRSYRIHLKHIDGPPVMSRRYAARFKTNFG